LTRFRVLRLLSRGLHALSLLVLFSAGLAALAATCLAALGHLPWLTLDLRFGDTVVSQAGPIVQIAVTVLLLALAFFFPASRRVLALELSHRDFSVRMEDIARAYHLCHTADRAGVFTLSSEFDAVRERLAYLRDHPDLERLEPDVLEVAAQMSHQARHLADVYSDEKVTRARAFLTQRQEEAERQQTRIVEALHACRDIRKWRQQVELEESVVASQLSQLHEQLDAALPDLGLKTVPTGENVVSIPQKPAAE